MHHHRHSIVGCNHRTLSLPSAAGRAKEYKGEQPGGLTALAYDSYLIALNAMKTAGVEDSKKIRDAIASTKDLETTTGKTTLNADGDPIKSAVIKTVKDGKFTYIDMVNPGDLKAK